MLDSFRNFTKSLFGKIVVFMILGVIAVAFALGDVMGVRGGGGGNSATLVTVGNHKITEAEVSQRLQMLLRSLNERGQPVTMEELLQRGGYEYVIEELIRAHSIEQFAKDSGVLVDQQTIESAIANNPNFQGVDGKFSQIVFDGTLRNSGKTLKEWRQDIATDHYYRWLLPDPQVRTPLADGLIAPYATMLLERRTGWATIIRPQDMDAGPDPDDKALTAFYTRNKTRYQVPQRRVMRYAIVRPDQFKAQSAATDQDIQQAFANSGARFAANEKRTVRVVVLPDQNAANTVAAEVKGGKAVADAAKARGLEASNYEDAEKAKLSAEASPAIADAAFGAAATGVVGPIQTPFGWAVIKVEKIEKIAAKTIDQVRGELTEEVTARKTAQALGNYRQSLDDMIGNSATFDEVMAGGKLTAQRTPALIANGTDPDNPLKGDAKPDPVMTAIATAGFQFEPDTQESLIIPIDKEGSFAVVILERVVAAAPRPLDSIKPQVLADYRLDQQMIKARKVATDLRAEINKGTPMREAIAKLGIRAEPPKAFDMVRGNMKPTDAPQTRMAFSMAAKSAKMIEAPDRAGYIVVFVDTIVETDGRKDAKAMETARTGLTPVIRDELALQFFEGVKRSVGVQRNEANIAALRARLGRTGQ